MVFIEINERAKRAFESQHDRILKLRKNGKISDKYFAVLANEYNTVLEAYNDIYSLLIDTQLDIENALIIEKQRTRTEHLKGLQYKAGFNIINNLLEKL